MIRYFSQLGQVVAKGGDGISAPFNPNFDDNAIAVYDFVDESNVDKDVSNLVRTVFDKRNGQPTLGSEILPNTNGFETTNWVDSNADGMADGLTNYLGNVAIVTNFNVNQRAQRCWKSGGGLYCGFYIPALNKPANLIHKVVITYTATKTVALGSGSGTILTFPIALTPSTVTEYFLGWGVSNFYLTCGSGDDGAEMIIQSLSIRAIQENTLYQATATNKPLWSADGITFDGVDNYLKAFFSATLTQPFTIYAVLKKLSNTANDLHFSGIDVTNDIGIAEKADGRDNNFADIGNGVFDVVTFKLNGANSFLRINNGNRVKFSSTKIISGLMLCTNYQANGGFAHDIVKDIVVRGDDSETDQDSIVNGLKRNRQLQFTSESHTGKRLCVIGDSVISNENYGDFVSDNITYEFNYINNLCLGGDTMSGQRTKWMALTKAERKTFDCVIIQVGLNDVDSEDTPQTFEWYYQQLIDTIKSDISTTCKIIICKMTCGKQTFIDTYGAVLGATYWARWTRMNANIATIGYFNHVDAIVVSHETELNNGSDDLKAEYLGVYGWVHPNIAGRQVIADAWDVAFTALAI